MNQPMAEKQKAVFFWIIGGGFTFLGLLSFTLGGFVTLRGMRTNQWPATTGRIIESKVNESPGKGRKYVVSVRYAYEVDGQKFEGNSMGYGTKDYSRSRARKELSLFPMGKEVQVYYDPAAPSQCVLFKGIGLSWLAITIGLIQLVIGLLVIFHMARKKTAQIK